MAFLILPLLAVGLDQLSKLWASKALAASSVSLLGGLLDLELVHNTGAAFSTFLGKKELLLVLTSLAMIAVCIYLLRQKNKITKLEKIAWLMVLGGGIGNIIDRIRFGYVVDFINIHVLPVFNIADCFITVGCALLIIAVLLDGKSDKR